jgi:methionyl-tRNA formyltransferase
LPKYRGASAINWAVIKGETVTGLSLFWVDPGIDTGPVLLQKEVTIDPNDTTGSLYFNKIFPLGIEAIGEAVDLINKDNPPRMVQDETKASYDPPCGDEPGAYTTYNGKMVRIFDARLQNGTNSPPPGQITGVGDEEITIALKGGTLMVKRMRGDGAKVSGAELAKQLGLKIGDCLG